MLRRPPTSIELKLDDIREYELMRQQMAKEQEKKSVNEPLSLPTGPKSKEEIYSRIGYVPGDKAKTAQNLPHFV